MKLRTQACQEQRLIILASGFHPWLARQALLELCAHRPLHMQEHVEQGCQLFDSLETS